MFSSISMFVCAPVTGLKKKEVNNVKKVLQKCIKCKCKYGVLTLLTFVSFTFFIFLKILKIF